MLLKIYKEKTAKCPRRQIKMRWFYFSFLFKSKTILSTFYWPNSV